MKPTFNDRFIAWLALVSGIAISCIAEFYSIMGLIAIYPAALIPIIVMGAVLGVGKLSATVWVKQNWDWSPAFLKAYILPAIGLLMLITSVGVFGFLSKAHSDQSLVSGDVQAKIAVYDEKIKIEKDNIDADRKALKQMDEAVDQVMARSTTEGGAARSVDIRRSQQKERSRLLADISASQQRISALNEERAPVAAEVRKVEAEVGPIKYIASFVYGSNPDANVLEKAVSWVSILIVIVLDPLAIVLLLASQYSFQRFAESNTVEEQGQNYKTDFEGVRMPNSEWIQTGPAFRYQGPPHATGTDDPIDFPKYEPDDGPLTQEQLDAIKEDAEKNKPSGEILAQEHLFEKANEFIAVWKANDRTTESMPEPETVAAPPVAVKTVESSNIRRMKVFPKITQPQPVKEESAPQLVPDFVDGDYVVINGQRYHKRAAPAGYIQNEEQKDSNLWTNTVSNNNPQSITPQEYIDAVKRSAE
jgi:energy-converting hydrogenase Eha subunit A